MATSKEELVETLPHLFRFKWYAWARKFFESTNRMNLLCAANQISKSSTAIRKNIHLATDKRVWKKFFYKRTPVQFWYCYPSKEVATSEFMTKWLPEFMPKRGEFSDEQYKEYCKDPVYGWRVEYKDKMIHAIYWNSGITTFFKTYAQNVHTLQSGTVDMITCDEELPEELYDELMFRLEASEGIFNMIFTATRNQLMWYRAIMCIGKDMELFKDALKLKVSMYDCREYEDGSPGAYHDETRIQKALDKCRNDAQRKRRVLGEFTADEGRKYPTFDPERHFMKPVEIPSDWQIIGGVDPGSGGAKGHPTGLGFIAVRPDYKLGYVFRGWRGDNIDTTAGDALQKFIEVRGEHKCTMQTYDHASKDFYNIASRCGEAFVKAEKSHEIGEQIVNTLFQHDMLFIFDTPELQKLGTELMTLMADTPKRHAKDDLIDGALRYPGALVPWDWSAVDEYKRKQNPVSAEQKLQRELKAIEDWKMRRRRGDPEPVEDGFENWEEVESEVDYWNDMYG